MVFYRFLRLEDEYWCYAAFYNPKYLDCIVVLSYEICSHFFSVFTSARSQIGVVILIRLK